MKNLTKLLLPLILTSALSGCVLIHGYAPPIQQGNDIKANKVAQLRTGMSKDQVLALMGSPVYTNTFRDNQWDYVYTYQLYDHRLSEKRVLVYFSNGRVNRIEKDLNPGMQAKKV